MVVTMTSSGAVLVKAGVGVSTDISEVGVYGQTADTILTEFINQSESEVNVTTKIDYTAAYGTLSNDTKKVLDMIVSNLAAIYAVEYDMSGYSTRGEAESQINVLNNAAIRGMELLKQDPQKKALSG
jgi:hypothetical protein